MIGALLILAFVVAVGVVLYIHHRLTGGDNIQDTATTGEDSASAPKDSATDEPEECCGMHITCERDSLLAAVSSEIEYYDDEELDIYRGLGADDYSEEAIEEFRNVLLTLLPTDIAGWARSLQLRGIQLPSEVREELLMIVSEARAHA